MIQFLLNFRPFQILPKVLVLAFLAFTGCSSGPDAIAPVDIPADQAAERALEMYDQDGDGALNSAELSAIPGMQKYLDKYDQNADGSVSLDEITGRIELWEDQALGIRTMDVEVLMDDRPLYGAEVRFVPESYLGEGPKVATGTTDSKGFAKISVAVEELPEDLRKARLRGIYGGTYKIEVTHPNIKIPAKYNTSTILGEEVARDTIGKWVVLKLEKG